MERDLDRERSLEAERKKVFGACGGVCGEAPCIEWNRQEKERLEREAKRAEFLRGLEEKSGGHLSV
jgi:NADH:ubiquinone oxidoreductase subunit E